MIKNNIFSRYIISGMFVTVFHLIILNLNVQILKVPSYAISNFIATVASFFFSYSLHRCYTFKSKIKFFNGLWKFCLLNLFFLFFQTFSMYIFSDIYKFNYNLIFCINVTITIFLGFIFNKSMIFKS